MGSFDSMANVTALIYDTERTDNLPIKPIVEAQLHECPQAILWCNGGLLGLIPMERVKNTVILRNEKRGAGIVPTPLVFYWCDVVVLTSSTVTNIVRRQ